MFARFDDFDRSFSNFDLFRRRFDRLFRELDEARDPEVAYRTGPRGAIADAGSALLVTLEVPGVPEKDLKLTLNQDILTIEGERKNEVPKGFVAHRQERGAVRFSRSFTLPCRVDAEKTTATLKDGILSVSLAKAPEAQPRQIAVRAH